MATKNCGEDENCLALAFRRGISQECGGLMTERTRNSLDMKNAEKKRKTRAKKTSWDGVGGGSTPIICAVFAFRTKGKKEKGDLNVKL